MWKLEHITTGNGEVWLYHNADLVVSKTSNGWLSVTGDKSISRCHATLRINHSLLAVKNNVQSSVELEDMKSVNGTYLKRKPTTVNELRFSEKDRLVGGNKVTLQSGDIIRFGLYGCRYRLLHVPLIAATSMLPSSKGVYSNLLSLGATYSKEWTDSCTHLVMDNLQLSAKVGCALAKCRSIVHPGFLKDLLSTVQNKQTLLPNTADYLPTIIEPGIPQSPQLFHDNCERQRVLSGKTFVLSDSRSLKQLSPIVMAAGGVCRLLGKDVLPALLSGDALLAKTSADSQQRDPVVEAACKSLKDVGLHPIPVSDVVLAVLYCSTDRFCNPSLTQQLINKTSTLAPNNPGMVLAVESQSSMSIESSTGGSCISVDLEAGSSAPHVAPKCTKSHQLAPSAPTRTTLTDRPDESVPPITIELLGSETAALSSDVTMKSADVEDVASSASPTIKSRLARKRSRVDSHEGSAAKRVVPHQPTLTMDHTKGEEDMFGELECHGPTFVPKPNSTQQYPSQHVVNKPNNRQMFPSNRNSLPSGKAAICNTDKTLIVCTTETNASPAKYVTSTADTPTPKEFPQTEVFAVELENPVLPSLAPETLSTSCTDQSIEEAPPNLQLPTMSAFCLPRHEELEAPALTTRADTLKRSQIVCKLERKNEAENEPMLQGFQIPTVGIKRRRTQRRSVDTPDCSVADADRSVTPLQDEQHTPPPSKCQELEQSDEPSAQRIKLEPQSTQQMNLSRDGFLPSKRVMKTPDTLTVTTVPIVVAVNGGGGGDDGEIKGDTSTNADVQKLCQVVFRNLVVRRDLPEVTAENHISVQATNNFKIFKKTPHYSKSHPLPRIIGGVDLVPHSCLKKTDATLMWLDQHPVASNLLQEEERDRLEQEEVENVWDGRAGTTSRRSQAVGISRTNAPSILNYTGVRGDMNRTDSLSSHSLIKLNKNATARKFSIPAATLKRRRNARSERIF